MTPIKRFPWSRPDVQCVPTDIKAITSAFFSDDTILIQTCITRLFSTASGKLRCRSNSTRIDRSAKIVMFVGVIIRNPLPSCVIVYYCSGQLPFSTV